MISEKDIKKYCRKMPTSIDKRNKNEFLKEYALDKIDSMKIDDYVLGKGKKTFCYKMERELIRYGSILGNTSFKYGIYYGKTSENKENKYRYKEEFGKNEDEAFIKIKEEIKQLIVKSRKMKQFLDVESKLTGMFKHKIMYLYSDEMMLPVYNMNDLAHFSKKLKLKKCKNYEEYQIQLVEFMRNNTKCVSTLEFANYLYGRYGRYKCAEENIKEYQDEKRINEKINNSKSMATVNHYGKPKKAPDIQYDGEIPYYKRDYKAAKQAAINAGYKCEICSKHKTFVTKKGTNYIEHHHLIPMSSQNIYEYSIDIPENIVCLCSNCHNEIHYGIRNNELIEKLCKKRIDKLKELIKDDKLTTKKIEGYYK